jgi:energy-converting hydrogenase Eha subunit C
VTRNKKSLDPQHFFWTTSRDVIFMKRCIMGVMSMNYALPHAMVCWITSVTYIDITIWACVQPNNTKILLVLAMQPRLAQSLFWTGNAPWAKKGLGYQAHQWLWTSFTRILAYHKTNLWLARRTAILSPHWVLNLILRPLCIALACRHGLFVHVGSKAQVLVSTILIIRDSRLK